MDGFGGLAKKEKQLMKGFIFFFCKNLARRFRVKKDGGFSSAEPAFSEGSRGYLR
jgi:hypothetical protein